MSLKILIQPHISTVFFVFMNTLYVYGYNLARAAKAVMPRLFLPVFIAFETKACHFQFLSSD